MFGLVAEGSGHPAAARLDVLDLESRNEPEGGSRRTHGTECLLVAVAVQEHAPFRNRVEPQAQGAAVVFAREPLLQQHRVLGDLPAFRTGKQGRDLVAKREQARRLEPDDRDAAFGKREEGGQGPARLDAGFAGQTVREEGPAAAKGPALRFRRSYLVTRRSQDPDRRAGDPGFEPATERIGEQHHLAPRGIGARGAGQFRPRPEGGRAASAARAGAR